MILLDSNRYCFTGYFGYDYIKSSQINWYEDIVNYTTAQCGEIIPSLLLYHIPVPEFNDAWDAVATGEATLISGEKREAVCCPEYNSGFFNKVLELGSSKAMIVGHDHVNNFNVLYKGVHFIYGVKSTTGIYYDDDLLGCNVIIIHSDKSLGFEQIYHTYEEIK